MTFELTLDTNAVIVLADGQSSDGTHDPLSTLMGLHREGRLELASTTAARRDIANDTDVARRTRTLGFLESLPMVPALARLDVSTWDRGDVLASDEDAAMANEVMAVVRPNAVFRVGHVNSRNSATDVDHVVAHLLAGRDIFVTLDKRVLKRANALAERFSIVVCTPSESVWRVRLEGTRR